MSVPLYVKQDELHRICERMTRDGFVQRSTAKHQVLCMARSEPDGTTTFITVYINGKGEYTVSRVDYTIIYPYVDRNNPPIEIVEN